MGREQHPLDALVAASVFAHQHGVETHGLDPVRTVHVDRCGANAELCGTGGAGLGGAGDMSVADALLSACGRSLGDRYAQAGPCGCGLDGFPEQPGVGVHASIVGGSHSHPQPERLSQRQDLPRIGTPVHLKPRRASGCLLGQTAIGAHKQVEPNIVFALLSASPVAPMGRPSLPGPHMLPADADGRAERRQRHRGHDVQASSALVQGSYGAKSFDVTPVRESSTRCRRWARPRVARRGSDPSWPLPRRHEPPRRARRCSRAAERRLPVTRSSGTPATRPPTACSPPPRLSAPSAPCAADPPAAPAQTRSRPMTLRLACPVDGPRSRKFSRKM